MIVCIYSAEAPTVENCFKVAQLVGHVWYSRYTSVTEIVTGDDYGLSLEVVRLAQLYKMPVRVMGIRRRARNGVTPYTRVVGSYIDRDNFMLSSSDVVHLIGAKAQPLTEVCRRLERVVYAYC